VYVVSAASCKMQSEINHLSVESGPWSCRRWNTGKTHFDAEVPSTFQF